MSNLILGIGSRIKHPKFGTGVVIQVWSDCYDIIFIDHGFKQIMHGDENLEIVEFRSMDSDPISFDKVEKTLVKILRRFSDIQENVELAGKWQGGKLILESADRSLQSKEIPVENLFHKIVMIRDRLRVMEQKINSSKLSDEDKIELQQYITRIYGSLTTFNVLFASKGDQFVGEKS